MRLTQFTDYSLRVLIYLALRPKERTTIDQLTNAYDVSRHHIRSVVHHLAKLGYIDSTQGKGGGVTLAFEPAQISIREIVENTENDFYIVECFNPDGNFCPIEPSCVLKQALSEASKSFLKTLEGYTIEDLIRNKKTQLSGLLEIT
ncbi:MAG: Rrf2 family transcriptional regulator [Gammaproteobacteria bacterium]|nr:MAG: Rrf2 family transcriptional regulator [Gammaproteobacteria bacterium]